MKARVPTAYRVLDGLSQEQAGFLATGRTHLVRAHCEGDKPNYLTNTSPPQRRLAEEAEEGVEAGAGPTDIHPAIKGLLRRTP